MTAEKISSEWEFRRDEWIAAVRELVDQVAQWSQEQEWSVHRENKQIRERAVGIYVLPALRIRNAQTEFRLSPDALTVEGFEGRVDFEAWPALNRVKLLRRQGKWIVMTDSNVPLRDEWGRDAFLRLARDLAGLP